MRGRQRVGRDRSAPAAAAVGLEIPIPSGCRQPVFDLDIGVGGRRGGHLDAAERRQIGERVAAAFGFASPFHPRAQQSATGSTRISTDESWYAGMESELSLLTCSPHRVRRDEQHGCEFQHGCAILALLDIDSYLNLCSGGAGYSACSSASAPSNRKLKPMMQQAAPQAHLQEALQAKLATSSVLPYRCTWPPADTGTADEVRSVFHPAPATLRSDPGPPALHPLLGRRSACSKVSFSVAATGCSSCSAPHQDQPGLESLHGASPSLSTALCS